MSDFESEPEFFQPELSPDVARNVLLAHSAAFMQRVWPAWLLVANKESIGEQGIVAGAIGDCLHYGAMVAEDMGVDPIAACRTALEARTGRSAEHLTTIGEIASLVLVTHGLPEVEGFGEDDPRDILSQAEHEATQLIVDGTNNMHAMLSGLRDLDPVHVTTEQKALVFGNFFNAMLFTLRNNFNRHAEWVEGEFVLLT